MKQSKVTVVIIALIAIMGCKCSDGPEGPAGPEGPTAIFVTGYIYDYDTYSAGYVRISAIPNVPSVDISDNALILERTSYYNCLSYYNYELPLIQGDEAQLTIDYTKINGTSGTAGSNITLPGEFEYTSHEPDSTIILSLGDSLEVEWAASSDANGYYIYMSLYYRYLDTLGAYHYVSVGLDTAITDTGIFFPSSRIFPNQNEIDTITWVDSYSGIHVYAISGPLFPGDDGNITGDGIGRFNGLNYGGRLNLDLEGAGLLAGQSEDPKEKLQEFIIKSTHEQFSIE